MGIAWGFWWDCHCYSVPVSLGLLVIYPAWVGESPWGSQEGTALRRWPPRMVRMCLSARKAESRFRLEELAPQPGRGLHGLSKLKGIPKMEMEAWGDAGISATLGFSVLLAKFLLVLQSPLEMPASFTFFLWALAERYLLFFGSSITYGFMFFFF